MWSDMFSLQLPALEKVLRTVLVYGGLAILLRLAGKRDLAQLNTFDLVVMLLLSNVVQNAVIGPDNSLSGGLLGAVVLVGVNAVWVRVVGRSNRLVRLFEGSPTVLVKDGPLSIGAGNFSTGGNPNRFASLMVLDTPYVYQGGDLVMQFTHTGSDSINTPAFLDGASSSAPGYGTSFRAISANTNVATSGIAASVTIVEIAFTPTITQAITLAANQVIISGGGGLQGATYQILTTTNVALPADQWTPMVTNQFGGSGGFSYTNIIQPNTPAQYFRVILP